MLDIDQKRAVIDNGKNLLIVAGAGSGKTTVLEWKIYYLVKIKKVDPKDILVLSYTNKATSELIKRVEDKGISPDITNFHKLSLRLINNKKKIIADNYDIILKYISSQDPNVMYDLIGHYMKTRPMISNKIEKQLFAILYLNNVKFKYKAEYEYFKLYRPSFKIIANDFTTYLDYIPQSNIIKKAIVKAFAHSVEVTSGYNEKTKRLIKSYGNNKQNYLIKLCSAFIKKYKSTNLKMDDLKKYRAICMNNKDLIVLMSFLINLIKYYEKYMESINSIDFEDIINLAIHTPKNQMRKYKYVMIDEYQDISSNRYKLIEQIVYVSNAHLIVVGDDWQSIYSFAGSEIFLFKKFTERKESKIIYLNHTYRNSQDLINAAGRFIMNNEKQLNKKLISSKKMVNPIIIYFYLNIVDGVKNTIHKIAEEFGIEKEILIVSRYEFDICLLIDNKNFIKNGDVIISNDYPNLRITFLTIHRAKGLGYDNVIILNNRNCVHGFPSRVVEPDCMKIFNLNGEQLSEERRLLYVALTRTKNKVYLMAPKKGHSTFVRELLKYEEVVSYHN